MMAQQMPPPVQLPMAMSPLQTVVLILFLVMCASLPVIAGSLVMMTSYIRGIYRIIKEESEHERARRSSPEAKYLAQRLAKKIEDGKKD